MIFKIIDICFSKLKILISLVNFFIIVLSIFMLIYWLFVVANVSVSGFLSYFANNIINFFSVIIPDKTKVSDISQITPVFVSIILCVIAYLVNYLITFVDNCHNKYKNYVESYKKHLEYKINTQLHKDFLSELKKTNLLLLKFKVTVTKKSSYLADFECEQINPDEIQENIMKSLYQSIKSSDIVEKGFDRGAMYIVSSKIENSKDLFTLIVSQVSDLMKQNYNQNLKITFSCVAELLENLNNCAIVQNLLSKILSLNIFDKLVATPKFKLYFDNLLPNVYNFTVVGDYNLSQDITITENIVLYSLTKK